MNKKKMIYINNIIIKSENDFKIIRWQVISKNEVICFMPLLRSRQKGHKNYLHNII